MATISKINSEKGLHSGEKLWAECPTLTCGHCICSPAVRWCVTLEHSCQVLPLTR